MNRANIKFLPFIIHTSCNLIDLLYYTSADLFQKELRFFCCSIYICSNDDGFD